MLVNKKSGRREEDAKSLRAWIEKSVSSSKNKPSLKGNLLLSHRLSFFLWCNKRHAKASYLIIMESELRKKNHHDSWKLFSNEVSSFLPHDHGEWLFLSFKYPRIMSLSSSLALLARYVTSQSLELHHMINRSKWDDVWIMMAIIQPSLYNQPSDASEYEFRC